MSSHGVALILVAAGPGTRLGAGQPKALVECGGRPLLVHALDSIERALETGGLDACAVVVVAPSGYDGEVRRLHAARPWPTHVVAGGEQRQDSVRAGLDACPQADIVVVHDAARPFLAPSTLALVIAAAAADGAAIAAVPAVDTVKIADEDRLVRATPPRETVWLAQTPQAFRREVLHAAHERAINRAATDDAALVEASGLPVRIVAGDPVARKITTGDDLRWAEWMLQSGQWPR